MTTPSLTIITLNTPEIHDYAKARNEALAKAKTEWVLFVDSDEVITQALENEINDTLRHSFNNYDAYYLSRQVTFFNRILKYGETGNAKFIRLAKKSFGRWVHPVHEVWVGRGRVGELKNPLLHNAHPTVSSFLRKVNRYSTLEAHYRKSQGRSSSLLKIATYPLAKFQLNYIFKLGFLDGVPGLIMAIMMSLHSYLTWTKLYLLQQQSTPDSK